MFDPIVNEIRRNRDAYAKQFNYDLRAIFEDMQKRRQQSDRRYVSLPPKKIAKNKNEA